MKTLIYVVGDRVVAALVRGDRELSEDKLKAVLGVRRVKMADPEAIVRASPARRSGFAGPVGIKDVEIVADEELRGDAQLRHRRQRGRPAPAQRELGA